MFWSVTGLRSSILSPFNKIPAPFGRVSIIKVPFRSIAPFGIERILEKADEIDVFVSQRGVMNGGGNYHSIVIRPGFDTLKAVQEERVYTINQKLISSPTFRFVKGINELRRIFYPEQFDNIDSLKSEELLDRQTLAEILVRFKHREIFVPSSKYYKGNIL